MRAWQIATIHEELEKDMDQGTLASRNTSTIHTSIPR